MIWRLTLLALALLAGPAWAVTPTEKLCIITASTKLPAVPGLEIVGSSTTSIAPAVGIPRMVETFDTPVRAAQALDSTFSILDDRLAQTLRSAGAFQDVIEAVLKHSSGAFDTVLFIKAAGLDAKYGFTCIVSSYNAVYAAPGGLIE